MRALRVGIDVGGTFTDVVAIDAATRRLLAKVKVPTTHTAAEGVAAGIVQGLATLLEEHGIAPSEIGFIAHSTTQATNALLEGDVASVDVIGLAVGPASWLARAQMRFAPLLLAPNVRWAPRFTFVRDAPSAERAVDAARSRSADAVAVSEAFAVDDPLREEQVVAYARERALPATSGHEVSTMYGLRARTRTAALNAAILPRMLRTARMTAGAVAAANIEAPLMIMRSDGGVMDVHEVEKRPILTLLSGPAAGVAGALLYENVTDGIFIEVGGTSADCSAICGGLPQMRPARVGGHRTLLRTLDVRTLAIAGGSLVHVENGVVSDVGPRSAHIAGFAYAAFSPGLVHDAVYEPVRIDEGSVLALRARDGSQIAITPTCAANALGVMPAHAFACGDAQAARRALSLAATALGLDPDSLARTILDIAAAKLKAAVDELIADYGLDPTTLVVIGGGGGAAALVPYAARSLGYEFRLAHDAEVISPIGVALALVRDVVERTMLDPSPSDIVAIRREAQERVIAAGADPARVEVLVEIDRRRNIVRATASGATELAQSSTHAVASPLERVAAAARQARVEPSDVVMLGAFGTLALYRARRKVRGWFGRVVVTDYACVVDERAVVRLLVRAARATFGTAGACEATLRSAIEGATAYGDVGRALPRTYLIYAGRFTDLSGVATAEQAVGLAEEELHGFEPAEAIAIVTAQVQA